MTNPRKHLASIFVLLLLLAAPYGVLAEEEISDPLEGLNRKIFWFNDTLDIYLMEPVARGYDYVLPYQAKQSVGRFFSNLRSPIYVVSDLVQLKIDQAFIHTTRFLLNSTIGLGGLFDVAQYTGLEPHEEDFGVALAYRGVPSGPYLVLPILGPSNFRDTLGLVVDGFLYPPSYIDPMSVGIGLRIAEGIDTRAGLLEAVETAKDTSLDYYLFSKAAYYQYRRSLLTDGLEEEEEVELE